MLRTAPRPPDSPAPAPPPYRRSRGPFFALVLLLVVGVAAVVFLVVAGGEETPDDAPATDASAPSTAEPSATLDPEASAKADIAATHRQAWEAFVAVASDPNGQIDDPRLAQYKNGSALAAAQLAIRRLRSDGQVLQVTQHKLNPEVVELTAVSAVVEDCGIDVSGLVDADTGEVVVPAGPPEPSLVVATYELVDGVWMQNSFTDTKQSCVPPES